MNASLTPRALVGYDARCPFCRALVARSAPVFGRRGVAWEPLQHPRWAGRLGFRPGDGPPAEDAELPLLLPDGRILYGPHAWAWLLRQVWWLWPLGVALELPGLRQLSQPAYRWLARNRHRLPGPGRAAPVARGPHRATTFLELP